MSAEPRRRGGGGGGGGGGGCRADQPQTHFPAPLSTTTTPPSLSTHTHTQSPARARAHMLMCPLDRNTSRKHTTWGWRSELWLMISLSTYLETYSRSCAHAWHGGGAWRAGGLAHGARACTHARARGLSSFCAAARPARGARRPLHPLRAHHLLDGDKVAGLRVPGEQDGPERACGRGGGAPGGLGTRGRGGAAEAAAAPGRAWMAAPGPSAGPAALSSTPITRFSSAHSPSPMPRTNWYRGRASTNERGSCDRWLAPVVIFQGLHFLMRPLAGLRGPLQAGGRGSASCPNPRRALLRVPFTASNF